MGSTNRTQDLVGGRFAILARLGRGGMATVFRAEDTRLHRIVALKVIDAEGDDDGRLFQREARAVAALSHRNILQIFDVSGPEESPPYLVMELVDGPSLHDALTDLGPPNPRTFVALAYGLVAGLAAAHTAGIVHRDIKPANVLLDRSGRLLLSDFGIAKAYRDAELLGKTTLADKSRVIATPEYIAPEVIEDEKAGPPSDIFALGSVLYALATGSIPFSHPDPVEVMTRILTTDYVRLTERGSALPRALAQLVDQCLSRAPRDRPTAKDLERILDKESARLDLRHPEDAIADWLRAGPTSDEAWEPKTTVTAVGEWRNVLTEIGRKGRAPRQPEDTDRIRGRDGGPGVPSGETTEIGTVPRAARLGGATETVVHHPVRQQLPNRRPWVVMGVGLITLGLIGWGVLRGSSGAGDKSTASLSATPLTEVQPTPAPVAVAAQPIPTAVPVPAMTVVTTQASPVVATPAQSVAVAAPAADPEPRTPRNTDADKRGARRADKGGAERGAPEKGASDKEAQGEATLEVLVQPWGSVFVDGVEKGRTPVFRRIDLAPGKHEVVIRHPVLGERRETVRLTAGQHKVLEIAFDSR